MKPLAILYAVAGVAAAAAGAVIAYRVWQKGETIAAAAGEVLEAVNPVNPNNVAATAVNKVVQAVTGDQHATLGTKLFEIFNKEPDLTAPTPGRGATPTNGKTAAPYLGDLPLDGDIYFGNDGSTGPADIGGVPATPFWYGAP